MGHRPDPAGLGRRDVADRLVPRPVRAEAVLPRRPGALHPGEPGGGPWLPNFEILGLARFVQSWGNGMVVTTVLAVLWREFPENRDGAMAVYVLGLYFGRIVAPSFSAYLINLPSWRSIFYWSTSRSASLRGARPRGSSSPTSPRQGASRASSTSPAWPC